RSSTSTSASSTRSARSWPRATAPPAERLLRRPGVDGERPRAMPVLGAHEVRLRDAPVFEHHVPARVLVAFERVERRHERARHRIELPHDGSRPLDETGVRSEIDERVAGPRANDAEKPRTAELPVVAESAPKRSVDEQKVRRAHRVAKPKQNLQPDGMRTVPRKNTPRTSSSEPRPDSIRRGHSSAETNASAAPKLRRLPCPRRWTTSHSPGDVSPPAARPSMAVFEEPKAGDPISMKAGKLDVPDRPIVPFIEGDGTGPDIWRASRAILDAAVEKAYQGKR